VTINWQSWLIWGASSTVVLTTMLAGSQGLGLTRMNLPYMLGTIVTEDREKAKFFGFFMHLFNGLVFSLAYVLIFQVLGEAQWWIGGLIGLVQALFVLVAVMNMLPGIHPHMATEDQGPEAHRQLEPPGFMALNYGINTPVSVLLAHCVFGIMMGVFYQVAR